MPFTNKGPILRSVRKGTTIGAADRRDGLQLLQAMGGGPTERGRGGGGGCVTKFGMGGRVGLGGRRPDPGELPLDSGFKEFRVEGSTA